MSTLTGTCMHCGKPGKRLNSYFLADDGSSPICLACVIEVLQHVDAIPGAVLTLMVSAPVIR